MKRNLSKLGKTLKALQIIGFTSTAFLLAACEEKEEVLPLYNKTDCLPENIDKHMAKFKSEKLRQQFFSRCHLYKGEFKPSSGRTWSVIIEEPLPEVNKTNCLPENVAKVKDEVSRERFASKCKLLNLH